MTIPSGSTRFTLTFLYSFPLFVLRSSASAIDADSATKIASEICRYFTRRIVPLLLSTQQSQNDMEPAQGCAKRSGSDFAHIAKYSLSMFSGLMWPTLVAKGIFCDRDKFRHVGRGRLARHIVAMEKFWRISFVRPLLLAHRAYLFRASPLSPNEMQNFRANDPALKDDVWRFYQGYGHA